MKSGIKQLFLVSYLKASNLYVIRFAVVGVLTVAIDFLLYQFLLSMGFIVPIAKGAGFLTGSIFSYFANKLFTFQAAKAPHRYLRFSFVYVFGLFLNIFINEVTLILLGQSQTSLLVGFTLATLFSATSNFLGIKHYVFTIRQNYR